MTITAGRRPGRRAQLIGRGVHSRVYRHPGSPVVLQVFEPDAPELTIDKVRREYRYLRAVFDPLLPELLPAQRLLVPQPGARLADTVLIKEFVPVHPSWSLRTTAAEQLPAATVSQLAVFLRVVRGSLADTSAGRAVGAEASLIPDIIDPPLDNLGVDTAGRLRLLDTNRLISTLELAQLEQSGRRLSVDEPGIAAHIYRLLFRRLMFLQHRFCGTPGTALRSDPLITRYLDPTQIDALFADSAAAGEPIR